jgi:Fe-S oxidoreductase
MTGISPERVAQHVRGSAVREGGRVIGDVDVACDGVTLRITFTRQDAPSQVEQFRAVVVEGEGPVVVASPTLLAAARALYRVHVVGPALPAEEFARLVYELGEALEALTPEQVAVLAGDEQDGDGDA